MKDDGHLPGDKPPEPELTVPHEGLVEPIVLTTVAVEFVKDWTDRGNNEWVKVRVAARAVDGDGVSHNEWIELDVEPSEILEFTEERRYRRLR